MRDARNPRDFVARTGADEETESDRPCLRARFADNRQAIAKRMIQEGHDATLGDN
jgi:hypothetical protein